MHLQYAVCSAYNIYVQPSVSHQLSFHTKHVQFHICIYFWYLAVCITLIVKPTCIYFLVLAACTTLGHFLLHRRCFYEFRKHLQYAFWCAYNFYVQPSISHQLSFHTKTRTISYMHIFSIFGRLYHINSETDMHIFSCLGRLYHINSQIFVYAFAPGRVYINPFCWNLET